MPRPRRLNEPVKLNLLIDRASKDKARQLAEERGISVSRLFEALLANVQPAAMEITETASPESEAA